MFAGFFFWAAVLRCYNNNLLEFLFFYFCVWLNIMLCWVGSRVAGVCISIFYSWVLLSILIRNTLISK